jgi:Flp pilus assembly protein TadG
MNVGELRRNQTMTMLTRFLGTAFPRASRPGSHSRLARFRGLESGAISVELAFMILLLAPLLLGIYDFGRFGMAQARMASAARAGTQYGMQDFSTATDLAGMIAAARADARDTNATLDVAASRACRCPGETGDTAGGGICGDGSYPPLRISVTVQGVHALLFAYPGLERSISVGATNVMRIR